MIEKLYEAYYAELVNWCSIMTREQSQAEDLVQEAFVKAMVNEQLLDTLLENQKRSWLYRTVKNLFIDRTRHCSFESAAEELPEEVSLEEAYDTLENEQLLEVLPDEERILFVMRYFQGYNSKELGQIFQLPPGTVRARLFSARKRLREMLQ